MPVILYILCIIPCIIAVVPRTIPIVLCILCIVPRAMPVVLCILSVIPCTMSVVPCIIPVVPCIIAVIPRPIAVEPCPIREISGKVTTVMAVCVTPGCHYATGQPGFKCKCGERGAQGRQYRSCYGRTIVQVRAPWQDRPPTVTDG